MRNNKYESGRSMVEMLGTLTIIGVLSIGGITGYSYAMDKYRANQTINDVMLIGIDMITQLSQQRTQAPVLSSDYGTKTTAGYDFTVVQNPEDNMQYGIQIMGIPSSVCKVVGDTLKQTVAVYVGNEDYTTDTETDPCDESDSNTMEFYFDTANLIVECKTDTDCGENKYCDNGWCFSGEKPEVSGMNSKQKCTASSDCNMGWTGSCARCETSGPYAGYCVENYIYSENSSCVLNDGTPGQCAVGTCQTQKCTYDTNKCGAKEYCSTQKSTCSEPFPNNETGVCVKTNQRFYRIIIDEKVYYISNNYMNWWDANAACKSLGNNYSLLNINDFISNWTNSGITDGNFSLTKLGTELFKYTISGTKIWTANTFDECQAYFVYSYGSISTATRNDNDRFVICKPQ